MSFFAFTTFIIFSVVTGSPPLPDKEIRNIVASGQYYTALRAIDALLDPSVKKSLRAKKQLDLEKLRSRCLFELGDYASCEKQLRVLLAGPAGPGTADHVECLAQLARTLSFQDIHNEAIKVIERAIHLHNAPSLHRLAIMLLLRAGRFGEILPHAKFLLGVNPINPYAHFVRGIALSSKNQLEDALPELTWGLKIPDAKRDAHFQLALLRARQHQPARSLEHLLEIVIDNPYDQDACYQAALQMARIQTPASKEMARNLKLYFLMLKKKQGELSRDSSFQAIGKSALAALMRAEKWKRLCVYDRLISEIHHAQAVARGNPEPFFYEADFWASVGLFTEAESALSRLEAQPGTISEDDQVKLRKLRTALSKGIKKLQVHADSPLAKARLELARSSWQDARTHLEKLLLEAVKAGRISFADKAARLLIARDPRSIRALAYFVERTAAPSLLVPRLYYLARLVKLMPEDKRLRDRLNKAQEEFLGKGSPVKQQNSKSLQAKSRWD